MIVLVALYALFALTFSLAKLALQYAAPFFLIGVRMLIAGSLLLGYLWLFDKNKLRIQKKHWPLFAQAIIFHIYLAYIPEFWALQYVTAAKTCLMYNLSPFMAAALSYFWFAEKITTKQLTGLCIGFAGFLPVLLQAQPTEQVAGMVGWLSIPELVLLLAVFASVYGWIIFRRLAKDEGYSPVAVNGISMIGGGVLALATSAATEGLVPAPITNVAPFALWLAALILVANVICYNLYGLMMTRYTATFLSFFGFITPLFAAVFDRLIAGTHLGWPFYATAFSVAFGLWLFYQDELGRTGRPSA